MELLKTIKEEEARPELERINPKKWKFRRAVRAVIFDKGGKIGLLHVSNLGYYKLPGGGIESSEVIEDALKRECLEEIGCNIAVKGEVGQVVEYRNYIGVEQESLCYVAEVVGEKSEAKLESDEKEAGFKTIWVDIDEAIKLIENSKPTSYDGPFIVIRDLVFLKRAKELTGK